MTRSQTESQEAGPCIIRGLSAISRSPGPRTLLESIKDINFCFCGVLVASGTMLSGVLHGGVCLRWLRCFARSLEQAVWFVWL